MRCLEPGERGSSAKCPHMPLLFPMAPALFLVAERIRYQGTGRKQLLEILAGINQSIARCFCTSMGLERPRLEVTKAARARRAHILEKRAPWRSKPDIL